MHYLYVSTVDRKGHPHSFKLRNGDPVPFGHEIVDLKVACEWSIRDLMRPEQQKALTLLFPTNAKERRRSRRAPA